MSFCRPLTSPPQAPGVLPAKMKELDYGNSKAFSMFREPMIRKKEDVTSNVEKAKWTHAKGTDHMRPRCSLNPRPGQRARGVAGVPSPQSCRMPLGLQHWRKSDKQEVPLGPTPSTWLPGKHSMKVRAGNPSKSDSTSSGTYQMKRSWEKTALVGTESPWLN